VAEDSSTFPGVCKPVGEGGLGFHSKWNLGWMHDTLGYMQIPPQFRGGQHQRISFGLVYAFDEQFVLPLSHDEVVHGKRSIFGRMPGHGDERYANLRAYYGFMWGHPGKKLLFMGQEFAQVTEWNHDEELPWHLLCDPRHAGIQALVRDLNRVYREVPALHQLDGERAGFEWLLLGDLGDSVFAWVRRGHDRAPAIVVCNFSDQALADYELDLPEGPAAWRVVLDTDAAAYGGEGLFDRSGPVMVEPGARGEPPFLRLDLAPLSTCFLVPV
jgi:1,4-alpha-glucan branching enzyme